MGFRNQRSTTCEMRSRAMDRANGLRGADRPQAQPPDKVSAGSQVRTILKKGAPYLLTACLLTPSATAQRPPDTTDTAAVEALLETLDDAIGDPTQLAEFLAELREHPLDLNTATAQDLAQIPALGPTLARNVVRYRAASGPFDVIADVLAVEGVTEEVLRAARPYLTIRPSRDAGRPSFNQLIRALQFEWLQRVGRRLDLGPGYDDDTTRTTYAGSPIRLYTRLSARAMRHLSINLTLEKDPGERFGWDPATATYGFDYATAHLAFRDLGRLKTLVIGDYVANVGQGVVLWRSSAFGKGREPVRPIARAGSGFIPYRSTEENRFFRGLAATVLLAPGVVMSAFASRRKLDAIVAASDTLDGFEETGAATGLSDNGLHRTPTEVLRKDAINEAVFGGTLDARLGRARVGVVGYHSRFDRPFQPGEAPYQRFQFAGSRATMAGVYGSVFLGEMHVFGEVARSPNASMGGVGGLTMAVTNRAEVVVAARHYPRDFVSLHGFAFGERNGATANETGYYAGLELRPSPRWRLAAFFDQYRFPWVRFGAPRPGTGHEILVVVEHRPRRWLTVYVQARSETKETGSAHVDARGRLLDAVEPETRQSARFHGDYRFSDQLRLRARLEVVRHASSKAPDAYGLVLYQDARWRLLPTLQLDLRLAFFDTDRFDARVFTYEDDLLYTFSAPAFNGRGQRAYALARWSPTGRLTLLAKAAVTRFEDVRSVGSGLDEVEGNRVREIRAQLRWRF